MEKKSIGKFIAALRKANGMTQKELAEKLNVSDKAISRWERDENLPDLTLIPVIANIFQVTCDEILRGERINPQQTNPENQDNDIISQKSVKQVERIINKRKTTFINGSILSVTLASIGMVCCLFLWYPFRRFVPSILFIAAIACEGIFCNLSFAAVKSVKCETNILDTYKKFILQSTEWVIFAIIFLFGGAISYEDYMGWFAFLINGILPVVICYIVKRIIMRIIASKKKSNTGK